MEEEARREEEGNQIMKTYYIYNSENDFYLGMVFAKDWADARSVYANQHSVPFGSVYACASPL
jgi:hypothetical protein